MTDGRERHPHRTATGIAAAVALVAASMLPAPAIAEPEAVGSGRAQQDADAQGNAVMPRVDFTLPDLDGQPRQLSEWDGDLVLLNFWATWCPPCTKEMPMFQDRYERHADKGFTIVAVAVDEQDATRAFVEEFGIGFPVLIGQDEAIAVGRDYGNRIGALPYSVLIDRDGLVREVHRGEVTENDLDAWLRHHL